MNRQQYIDFHKAICDEARSLSERKNHDYAGKGGEEPFANFKRCEALGICTTERGFLVRMTDKMSRLSSFCDAGTFKVADEKLRDTCLDLINYTALLLAYVESKHNTGVTITVGLPPEDPYEYDGE
jgi:hypothetical protein